MLLEVRSLAGDSRYRGLLRTGAERDWGEDYGSAYLHKGRYLTFDPLEGDASA